MSFWGALAGFAGFEGAIPEHAASSNGRCAAHGTQHLAKRERGAPVPKKTKEVTSESEKTTWLTSPET